jgi:hypothetical protein
VAADLDSPPVTSRNVRRPALIAVLVLSLIGCLATAGVLVLRGPGQSVAIAPGAQPTVPIGPAGATDPTATSAASASASASGSASAVAPTKKAKKAAGTATATATHRTSRLEAAGTSPSGRSAGKTVHGVKKGASVWNESGITKALAASGVSWFYDWAPTPGAVKAPSGVQFVPMMWGAGSVTAANLAAAKRDGSTLLGFNEPDMSGQSNMTVDQALGLWPQLEATGMRLGSPAVAWGADQSGQWLDRFMSGAKQRGYRVDFITLHWYGSDFTTPDAVSQLRSYVAATYARYHKPIWLTEYALINFGSGQKYPSASNQAAFVTASTTMLQSLGYVEHYAWFALPTSTDGTDGTGLYRPGGVATAPGKAYAAAG